MECWRWWLNDSKSLGWVGGKNADYQHFSAFSHNVLKGYLKQRIVYKGIINVEKEYWNSTHSCLYTHFNTLKENLLENIVEKGEIALLEQFHLFPLCFVYNLYL